MSSSSRMASNRPSACSGSIGSNRTWRPCRMTGSAYTLLLVATRALVAAIKHALDALAASQQPAECAMTQSTDVCFPDGAHVIGGRGLAQRFVGCAQASFVLFVCWHSLKSLN